MHDRPLVSPPPLNPSSNKSLRGRGLSHKLFPLLLARRLRERFRHLSMAVLLQLNAALVVIVIVALKRPQ